MKKICKITAVLLVFIFALTALTSCGRMYEGVQKKAKKAGYECITFEVPRVISLNKEMKEVGIDGEMKIACAIVKNNVEYACLYEFDKITTASAFVDKITDIFALSEEVSVARDNKVVIVGENATVEAIW